MAFGVLCSSEVITAHEAWAHTRSHKLENLLFRNALGLPEKMTVLKPWRSLQSQHKNKHNNDNNNTGILLFQYLKLLYFYTGLLIYEWHSGVPGWLR